jgi:hypothetical protein
LFDVSEMIRTTQDICEVFSIFHDGLIESAVLSGETLKLKVEISYLTDRIQEGFKYFFVDLDGFRDPEFRAWPAILGQEKKLITEFSTIFKSTLEILEAKLSGNRIDLACNLRDRSSEFCGGDLSFNASAATVRDEANKEYSVSELTEICKGYWDEWKARNAKQV